MTNSNMQDYVTILIADQLFGIPVLKVHDVLRGLKLTKIPLAPPEVAGALNLRGRIVTAINVRKRLGLPELEVVKEGMSIVVEHHGEPYSLMIDNVGEVLSLDQNGLQPTPVTLDSCWKEISGGVYRLEDKLLVVLQIERLLDFAGNTTIAA
ncbi:MAG: chemotaxis protein CheW [Sneathiella sp.]|jgi:purine-binding chemotaxis protein CheW|uniref:chemotaxis protein CheW n=1 Tax=Sneathiella sp. TaxID=1964365 RepID=UPI000C397B85|nr:chemotaxis protein CheW [Sneathiella sp.]MAL77609.1 chemotaxis protein CheW [Sneathiella sp.]|tara:strand:- start:1033 stop:1488 length:456 start_codon:yes stop_codon:yes gene_type:complete